MDPAALGGALAGARQAQTAMAVAAEVIKTDQQAAQAIIAMVEASADNLAQLAASPAPDSAGLVDMMV